MAFEGACVEKLTRRFEEPVVVKRGVVNDEIHHVGIATIFVGVDHCAVRKERPIGVFEFEGDHTGRVAAQVALAFGAEFAAHITGEGPFAAAEGRLIETHVALSANEGKLHGIEDGGFARAVDADEVGGALAVDGGVFKEMPVDEADAG